MPTLYEHAGGEEPIHRLEDAFYGKVLADPLLKPLFGEGQPEHVDHLTAFTCESFGGPDRFSRELPPSDRRPPRARDQRAAAGEVRRELAFNNGETFFTSIAIGQRALVRRVLERIRRCMRSRFALVGYSQGAAVVSGGLRRLLDEEPERVREALGAVVLYADPYSAGPGSSYDISLTAFGEPTSARVGRGALGAQTFRLGVKLSRVRDVCFAGDLVCDLSGNNALALYQALFAAIHSNYKTCCPVFPLTHLQGRWAARRLRVR